jgi:hypothetical protein
MCGFVELHNCLIKCFWLNGNDGRRVSGFIALHSQGIGESSSVLVLGLMNPGLLRVCFCCIATWHMHISGSITDFFRKGD